MEIIGLIVALVVAGWMAYDSSENQIPLMGDGREGSSVVWFILGFLLLIVFLPIYLFKRSSILNKRKQELLAPAQAYKSEGSADELKKFKDLLDAGAISQDEYERKKRQILGL